MERRGGCCIAMYGGGRGADVAWKVGQIMLRYRPIAPKPGSPAGSPKISPAPSETRAAARRPKRKRSANPSGCVRGRKTGKVDATAGSSSSINDDEKSSSTTSSSMIVTLPLMPETPERQCEPTESPRKPSSPLTPAAAALPRVVPPWMGRKEVGGMVVALGSWVTVACVTDSWREEEVPWRSDEAVTAALALDESPGFVSDGWDRVMWTNEAYRRMVMGREEAEEQAEDVKVGLVTGGLVPAAAACRAFTCRVRVRPGKERTSSSPLAAPCDVWRLDSGGCAWRLDVKAALSLSL